ncbi:hypothetical protein QBC42DRAFT_279361 [Cladorrhinum samala]|uniref:Uncharacterized protein n=1 Tax=Cladorrhinum samala TaxID=585594 RepID=A0AAV9HCM3_9PEZI|nr:hypothetical protein QBC42DRAFT_279361 [Cladorrhinum samala]
MMMIIILLLADSEAQFPEKDRTKLRVPNQELAMMVCRGSKGFEILLLIYSKGFNYENPLLETQSIGKRYFATLGLKFH